MAASTKVIAIGNSSGIILPKEMLSRLKVEKGDTLYVSEVPGGLQVTPHDEELARTMESADRVIRKYRDTLKKLAE
ncbi:AbrB/MazE/SpoVT family DNA-binding domain-containing protein [Acidobacteria bacterium AB60]|nr:AbrB/MazE/SpoVT family DNA-binding domain-containing protein [Acidobacteria bacterium AB60]